MLRITNRAFSIASLGATAILSLSALAGCANKVEMKPRADFLQYGTYRAKVESVPGSMTGLYLQLNGNGRFSMSTLEGGCFLTEDWGVWSAAQDELSLSVRKSRSRESCSSAWQTVEHEMAFHCSMRNVTDRSFQMLHDEIKQGTEWTAWERESGQGYASLERLRKEPVQDAVTLSAAPDADEGTEKPASGKAAAGAGQKP